MEEEKGRSLQRLPLLQPFLDDRVVDQFRRLTPLLTASGGHPVAIREGDLGHMRVDVNQMVQGTRRLGLDVSLTGMGGIERLIA